MYKPWCCAWRRVLPKNTKLTRAVWYFRLRELPSRKGVYDLVSICLHLQDRRTIIDVLLNALSRLEYRGYDSAGLSVSTATARKRRCCSSRSVRSTLCASIYLKHLSTWIAHSCRTLVWPTLVGPLMARPHHLTAIPTKVTQGVSLLWYIMVLSQTIAS